MKKLIFLLALTFLFIGNFPVMSAAANDVDVFIDGRMVVFSDQAPILVDRRILVPVRDVFEELGFTLTWDEATYTAILSRRDFHIVITSGSNVFSTNSMPFILDVPAQLIGGRIMVPLRLPLESVGYTLEWDGDSYTVIISTGRLAGSDL